MQSVATSREIVGSIRFHRVSLRPDWRSGRLRSGLEGCLVVGSRSSYVVLRGGLSHAERSMYRGVRTVTAWRVCVALDWHVQTTTRVVANFLLGCRRLKSKPAGFALAMFTGEQAELRLTGEKGNQWEQLSVT